MTFFFFYFFSLCKNKQKRHKMNIYYRFYPPPVYRCSSQQLLDFLSAPWPRQSFPSLRSPASPLWRLYLGLRRRLHPLSWVFSGAELLRAARRKLRKERGRRRVRGARALCRHAPPNLQNQSLPWVGCRGGRGAGMQS